MAIDIPSAQRRLRRIAERQHGVFTRADARSTGFTDDQIDRRLRNGVFVSVRSGVMVVAGAPPSWEQTALAAVLACGVGALACGPTAARIWQMSPRPPAQGIHVLTPSDALRSRRRGVVGHRTKILDRADVGQHQRIPVTSPARTLVDCAGLLGVDGLGQALDDGIRRQILTLDALRATSARLMVPGRRNRTVVAEVLGRRAPGYDPGDSDLEVEGLVRIRRAGLPTPVQQHPVRVPGGVLHIDLAYPALMIGIELDGWMWHRFRSDFDRDRRRLSWLTAAGWALLVPTTETLDDLVPQLRELMARRAVRPQQATA